MEYRSTLSGTPNYLRATVVGPRTPENARRFLKEVHDACVERGYTAVLLEMSFTGPSLDTATIFRVISQSSPDATKLRRIAYVEASVADPSKPVFAESVAVNRGVNVRLFPDATAAARWLDTAD
jgi:hypothetical protein